MERKLASVLVVALMGAPLSVTALGLGELDSDSGLNEPLSARIPLLSIRDNDAASIRVSLASSAAFERAGLERPFYLSRLKFEVKQAHNGNYYILVSTEEPFKEPFLDFLLNVRWPQGDLQREYTVLLNPPQYSPAAKLSDSVQNDRTSANRRRPQSGVSAPSRSSTQVAAAGEREIGGGRGASKITRYGPVQANQTLWGIASKVRPYDGVTVYQTMQAILQGNPGAFIGGDINVLMKGAVLRVPSREVIARIDANEAARQMQKQLARWQKQQASGSSKLPPAASTQDTANVAETASAEARPSSKGHLHVGAAGEDVAAQATASLADQALAPTQQNILQLQQRLAAVKEHNASLKSTNAQLQQQAKLLRKELVNLQLPAGVRLPIIEPTARRASASSATSQEIAADLHSETALASGSERPPPTALETTEDERIGQDEAKNAAAAQSEPITAASPAADPSARSESHGTQSTSAAIPPASEAQSSTAVADAQANPTQQQDSPSLKTRLLAYLPQGARQLVLLVSSLLLILLLLWAVYRRRRGVTEQPHEFSSATLAAPEGEALTAVKLDKTAANPGRADTQPQATTAVAENTPLDEAKAYIAYGRYDQAQELLDRALGEHPDSQELRLKLLEVLAAQGDRRGFEAEAQVLHTQVTDKSDPCWQRTLELARQVAPDHPLFSHAMPSDAERTTVPSEEERNTAAAATADSMTKPMRQALETELDLSSEELALELPASLGKEGEHRANGQEQSTVLEFDLGEIETFMSQQVKENAAPAFSQDSTDEDDWGPLDFSLPEDRAVPAENREANGADNDQDALQSGDFSLQSDELDTEGGSAAESDDLASLDEVGTKLDLARAYLDMGDATGARDLLSEVVTEGNAAQQGEAQDLLQQVG